MFDLNSLVISGVALLPLVFGLVEFSKKLGLSGKALTVESAVLGVLLAMLFQISLNGVPTDLAGWVSVCVVGISAGLSASGVYDFVNGRAPAVG